MALGCDPGNLKTLVKTWARRGNWEVFEEGGLKWAISWSILLGDMATTSATYFI